jgi:P-type Ca2+ transporter type 2C
MIDGGLTQAEALRRLHEEGPNEMAHHARRGWVALALQIVREPMILLLVACGVLYALLGDLREAWMLLAFVIVVMTISFVQQRRAEQSLRTLRELSSPRVSVLRDGVVQRIPGRELVRGDVVILSEGDRVPADCCLQEAQGLMVDESLLTGESAPVMRQDRLSAGSLVTQGTARAEVTAIGRGSALGRLDAAVSAMQPSSSPAQQEVARLVRRVAIGGGALSAALALLFAFMRDDWLHGLLAGITLAMAILPEELPVVLALFLALGAWRLARDRVLARQLPAIEWLGATTVLCVDKTGTLTFNRMRVRALWANSGEHDFVRDEGLDLPECLHGVLEYAVLASHRRPVDPMETAILEAGHHALAQTEHLHANWTLVEDYPLSPELLAMSRVWDSPDQQERMIAAKGAPEAVMDLCHVRPGVHARIVGQVAGLAAQGWRVLGVARARFGTQRLPQQQHDFEFEFLGLLALEDPVRPEVPSVISECRAAGMRVLMMTGDHPATALAVARQAGLDTSQGAVTGPELAACAPGALPSYLAQASVFCRVRPEQKLQIVQALRARGEVVAMTGDGVNDAPALRAAHVGVAMGARGTDVAREAASLVLMDDDVGSLVDAVRMGRRVHANLRKAMVFIVATHVPIVGLSFLPVLLGWPMLLMPVHVLCLQLLIDPACTLVFEAEPEESDLMRQPPRASSAQLVDRALVWRGGLQGLGVLLLCLVAGAWGRAEGDSEGSVRAVSVSLLVCASLMLILGNRSWAAGGWCRQPSLALRWLVPAVMIALCVAWSVPSCRDVLGFDRLTPVGWVALAVGTLGVAAWLEFVKRCGITGTRPPRRC